MCAGTGNWTRSPCTDGSAFASRIRARSADSVVDSGSASTRESIPPPPRPSPCCGRRPPKPDPRPRGSGATPVSPAPVPHPARHQIANLGRQRLAVELVVHCRLPRWCFPPALFEASLDPLDAERPPGGRVSLDERSLEPEIRVGGLEPHRHLHEHAPDRQLLPDADEDPCGPVRPTSV